MSKRSALAAGVLAVLLCTAGCGASKEDTYWAGYVAGEGIDTEAKSDPNCADGIDPSDVAARIRACAAWPKSQGAIYDECGEMLPDDVDSSVWMEGCTNGANDRPNYAAYGPRP